MSDDTATTTNGSRAVEQLALDAGGESATGFSTTAYVVLALSVLLLVALRLWRLTNSCLWFDEVFGVHAAARHQTWGGMLSFVAADIIHPPLFYALLKIWIALGGESLLWLRLFPALTASAAVVPFLLLCRELKMSAAETNLAVVLMALNGYLIKYAQEIRMYSLLLLFALASLWLFARYHNARRVVKRDLLALFVVNLLAVYTHYFGWLLVATEIAFLLVAARRKLPPFLLTTVAVFVGFAPWVYAVLNVSADASSGLAQNIGWVARPNLSTLAQFYFTLNEIIYYAQSSNERLYLSWSVLFSLFLFGLPVVWQLWRVWTLWRVGGNSRVARAFWWLLFFCVLPLASAFACSWLLPHSIWGTRHLIIIAPVYLILVAVSLARLRFFWLKTAAFALVACWALMSVFVLAARRDEKYIWCAWEVLARQLAGAERVNDRGVKIYAFEDVVAYHTWFALDSMREKGFKVEVIKNVPGLKEDPAYFLPRRFEEVKIKNWGEGTEVFVEDYFWVAFRDAAWRPERPPLKLLAERGYEVGEGFQFAASGNKGFLVPVRRR